MNRNSPDPNDEDRASVIDQVVEQYVKTLDSAGSTSIDELCQEYAHLMPELAEKLRATECIRNARLAAKLTPSLRLSELSDTEDFDQLPPAARIFGDFELLERLGGGSFGNVFRAWQLSTDAPVAIKILKSPDNPEGLKRFQREAQIGCKLKHPNIVTVFGTGVCDDQHFIVMECVVGLDLQRFSRSKPMPADQAARIILDVVQACHYAHVNGVIHRDIKPSNILVDEVTGNALVVDFGLAHDVASERLTASLQQLGTLKFMAPEQADRRLGPISLATDIYAIGTTLYFLLAGRTPFPRDAGTDGKSLIHEIVWDEPHPLHADVPKDLRTICRKCLQKVPIDRYATAAQLAKDLKCFLIGTPIRGRLPGPGRRFVRFCQRRPPLAASLAGLVLTAAIGTWLSISYASRARVSHQDAEYQRNQAAEAQESQALHDYAADMQAIQRAWTDGKARLIGELLTRHDPRHNGNQADIRGFEWYYWQHQLTDGSRVFNNEDACRCLAVDKHGNFLAAAGFNRVSIWNLKTGKREQRWQLPAQRTQFFSPDERSEKSDRSVAFSPDGRMVAATGYTHRPEPFGCLKVWDLASGNEVLSIKDDPGLSGHAVTFSPDGTHVVAGGFGHGWKSWDLKTKKEGIHPIGLVISPRRFVLLPKGQRVSMPSGADVTFLGFFKQHLFATMKFGGAAFKWPKGELVDDATAGALWGGKVPGGVIHFYGVRSLRAVSRDRHNVLQLTTTTKSGPSRPTKHPAPRTKSLPAVEITPPAQATCTDLNHRWLVAGGSDTHLYRWPLPALTDQSSQVGEPTIHRGHTREITTVRLLPRNQIASADWGGTIRVWSEKDSQVVKLPRDLHSLTVNVDARRQAIVLADANHQEVGNIPIQRGERLASTMFSSRQRFAVIWIAQISGNERSRTIMWNVHDRRPVDSLQGELPGKNWLAFSQDERVLAAISAPDSVKVWSTETGGLLHDFSFHGTHSLALSPDGSVLAANNAVATRTAATIALWNLRNGKRLYDLVVEFPTRPDRPRFLFSADGNRLVVAGQPCTVWDIHSGKQLASTLGEMQAEASAMSRDRRRLYFLSGDSVDICCAKTLRPLLHFSVTNANDITPSELVPGTNGFFTSDDLDRQLATLIDRWSSEDSPQFNQEP